jgi:Bacterial protein of unknown function (DUF899)
MRGRGAGREGGAVQRTGAYEYNYQPGTSAAAFATRLTPDGGPAKGAAMTGTDVATYVREKPGMSAFALEDGTVYHTYSAYARGLTACGARISGSTAPPRAATRQPTGGVATTSTPSAERRRGCRSVTADETQTSWHTLAGASLRAISVPIGG